MKTDIKTLDKSQIEVNFELDEKEFEEYLQKALEHLKEHVKVDGFRKGNVPKEMVEKQVGQENVLMEAGDLAVKKTYTKFVKENNLEPVGEPEVQIKKIAKGNPFSFTVKVAVLPEIELPDYKAIASKIKSNDIAVDEKEIEEAIVYLQKSRAKFSQIEKGAGHKDFVEIEYQMKDIHPVKSSEAGVPPEAEQFNWVNGGKVVKDRFILGEGGFLPDFENNILGMKAGEEKEFKAKFSANAPNNLAGKEGQFKVKIISVQKMELPEINDEFAKGLGAFDSLVALKVNLKEGIGLEKSENEKQRKRGEILSKITEKVYPVKSSKAGVSPSAKQFDQGEFNLPEKMVEYEQERLFGDLKNQVGAQFSREAGSRVAGKISFEEYLASVKKTEEEIKNSFKLEAEKRIKNYLVLRQIGKVEKIEISTEELDAEVSRVMKQRPFDSAQGKFDMGRLREYSKSAVFNEKVFQLLENFSG